MTTKNDLAVMKADGLKKVTAHARDYLSFTMTIPLGNKALKQVHTNQFLFCDLPKEFKLENWKYIAEALNSTDSRYSQAYFKQNRWYIEGVDISVDASGKAEMKLTLNAFASSISSFTQSARDMSNAYTNAVKKTTNQSSGKTKSKTKNKSNAVTTKKSVINEAWVKKYKVPSAVVNQIKKTCKVGKSDYDNVKAWFTWMDKNVNYDKYNGHKYDPPTIMKRGKGNCVDNSRTFRAGCHALGIKCNYVQGINCCSGGECANHQWNMVYIGNKKYTVDCGRICASWGSHWGSCSGGTKETTNSW